jgi:DNA repair protein RadC
MKNKPTYRIADMHYKDRPRERLAEIGAHALSNSELLAILLRVGVKGMNAVQLGNTILQTFDGLYGIHQASFQEICNVQGVGPAKAAQIKAAIELGHRLSLEEHESKTSISSPEDAASLVQYSMGALKQEHLWVIILNTKNQVVHIDKLYKGSLNASTVRIAEVFRAAIQHNAASIIMIHNHPSGDPTPSPEDISLTKAIFSAGNLLDIELLDHIIIGLGKFTSLKQKKLGFE